MLLRSPDRRWLSSDVQSDLLLVCRDGAVPAHSAFLAGSSPLLARLLSQPSSRLCGGCQAPRSLILAEVAVTECRALVELLYTGRTESLATRLSAVKELGRVLGVELDRLEMVRGKRRSVSHRASSDGPDGVHHRFRKSDDNLSAYQDLHLVRMSANTTKATTSVIPTKLRQLFQSSFFSKQHNAEHQECSSSSRSRQSPDSLAEPLSKLPVKTDPVPSDNILAESEPSEQVKVVVPNAVLSEVMDMIPVDNIKMETEDSGDTQDFPQMEGREEDEEDVNSCVTSYLSMNNPRNFVCDRCDAGFTFQRSYNKHRQGQCRQMGKTFNNDTVSTGGAKLKAKPKTVTSVQSRVKINSDNKPTGGSPVVKERNSLYKASQLKRKLEEASSSGSSSSLSKRPANSLLTVKVNAGGGAGGGAGGRKVPCGRCVKCRLADCGSCPPCTGGGDPSLARLCVKKVCRNKIWLAH